MAIVRHLERLDLQVEARHMDVNATYTLVKDREGVPHLQIDTYGSTKRKIRGKKSQTMRFTPEAIVELRSIIDKHFKA